MNGVRRAESGRVPGSAVMLRKVMMNVINIMNHKWGPPGPGKAVSELCRDHSGGLHMALGAAGRNGFRDRKTAPPPAGSSERRAGARC